MAAQKEPVSVPVRRWDLKKESELGKHELDAQGVIKRMKFFGLILSALFNKY